MEEEIGIVKTVKVLPKNQNMETETRERWFAKVFILILDKAMKIWLPVMSLIFTLIYVVTAYYVYNYPDLEKLVLCNIDK